MGKVVAEGGLQPVLVGKGHLQPIPRLATSRARRRWRHRLTVLSFMAPALVGILVFLIYPLVSAVYFSLTRFDLLSTPEWVGFRNYVYLFRYDHTAVTAASNTLWLVAILVPAR